MGRYRVLPYRKGSRSAKALAEALGGKVLRLEGSTFKPRENDIIINWGRSEGPAYAYLNPPILTQFASNKLKFFNLMKENNDDIIPQFWTDPAAIRDEDFPVVCRTILSGHSGAGIHIASNRDDLCVALLYVKYIKKSQEYRVHVARRLEETVTISVQRKARRLSVPGEEVNWQVRNLAGGFVFTREGFTLPNSCEEAAHRCLRATGLDFGAVDVIWNEHQQRAYVLEVNTAPGLEGTTVTDYASFFKGLDNGS